MEEKESHTTIGSRDCQIYSLPFPYCILYIIKNHELATRVANITFASAKISLARQISLKKDCQI